MNEYQSLQIAILPELNLLNEHRQDGLPHDLRYEHEGHKGLVRGAELPKLAETVGLTRQQVDSQPVDADYDQARSGCGNPHRHNHSKFATGLKTGNDQRPRSQFASNQSDIQDAACQNGPGKA